MHSILPKGQWRAKKNRDLASHVRTLWDEVSSLRELSGEHVGPSWAPLE
ncbi:MAG: hypothetical protein Ct9H90mP14_1190 [Methanobacteriota archaeon]|nr:MAG: hypothetical protein Ct9H90mP14_1190 [Euryarchaeota archaeon]